MSTTPIDQQPNELVDAINILVQEIIFVASQAPGVELSPEQRQQTREHLEMLLDSPVEAMRFVNRQDDIAEANQQVLAQGRALIVGQHRSLANAIVVVVGVLVVGIWVSFWRG